MSRFIAICGHVIVQAHCTAISCIYLFIFLFLWFIQVISHLINCDIFTSLCSFISQPPINPKLSCSAHCKKKHHYKKGDAIVPPQHLLKDSTSFRSYTLITPCKRATTSPYCHLISSKGTLWFLCCLKMEMTWIVSFTFLHLKIHKNIQFTTWVYTR